MTELESCIHFFEVELEPPCYLSLSVVSLYQSTIKFLKELQETKREVGL